MHYLDRRGGRPCQPLMFLEEQGTVKMDAGARTARGNKFPRASPAAAQASSPGIAGVPRQRHGSSVGPGAITSELPGFKASTACQRRLQPAAVEERIFRKKEKNRKKETSTASGGRRCVQLAGTK